MDFLLACYDPGRKIQDQNTPSPNGRGIGLMIVEAGRYGIMSFPHFTDYRVFRILPASPLP